MVWGRYLQHPVRNEVWCTEMSVTVPWPDWGWCRPGCARRFLLFFVLLFLPGKIEKAVTGVKLSSRNVVVTLQAPAAASQEVAKWPQGCAQGWCCLPVLVVPPLPPEGSWGTVLWYFRLLCKKHLKRKTVYSLNCTSVDNSSTSGGFFHLSHCRTWRAHTSKEELWARGRRSCVLEFWWISFLLASLTAGWECKWMPSTRAHADILSHATVWHLNRRLLLFFPQSQVLGCCEVSQLTYGWPLAHVLC